MRLLISSSHIHTHYWYKTLHTTDFNSLSAGVHSARVALLAEKAEVQYNPDHISPEIIAEEINGLGFHADYLPDASSGDSSILDLKVCTT